MFRNYLYMILASGTAVGKSMNSADFDQYNSFFGTSNYNLLRAIGLVVATLVGASLCRSQGSYDSVQSYAQRRQPR